MDEKTNTCIVNYKRVDGQGINNRLSMQLKPETEYEYLVSGVSDATEKDLPPMPNGEE